MLRGKTQVIGMMLCALFTWLFNFIVPYIYNVASGKLGAKTGLIFSGLCLLITVVSFFVVPDIVSMTTEEFDWLYAKGFPVRKVESTTEEI
ncbi:hypothetical protein BJ878DRAFT_333851 [Calycina marina]|uniref:Uncharacterized protein n=1 Tax=Calycina marina TaxID=1763456 RepID=A0A9P8CAX1_9HELO|nr:hypothetical protein BJ878DRAFT_333851 [Calycina marina]